jgi:uncharacterized FAD-dependent dehydrogenase
MHYDVIIVGAGPAGLAAAFELTTLTDLSILMIDKGRSMNGRNCTSLESFCVDHFPCDVTHGFGGAGLFSDGKLCLDSSVGGDITRFYTTQEADELMNRVVAMLSLDELPIQIPSMNLHGLKDFQRELSHVGLDFGWYSVARINLAERLRKSAALEKYLLDHGVDFAFETDVTEFFGDSTYTVKTSQEEYTASYLVLAPGKVGAHWLQQQCRRLGISSENNPLYLGARLELPRQVTAELAALSDNPKISMGTGRNRIKTHCFSDKGRAVLADYDGRKLIDGNYLENGETDRASVNVIMPVDLPSHIIPYVWSMHFIDQVNDFGRGRPVAQTVGDLFRFQQSDPGHLAELHLTLQDCAPSDLSVLLSLRYAHKFREFVTALNHVIPGFASEENVLYAPFVEWWMRKIAVDAHFETRRKNLYAIGDGAGMSQGIISAGMMGIACARGIAEKYTQR